MYPDGARQTAAGHHRVPRPGGPCRCHGCACGDPPDPRRYGMGTGLGLRLPASAPTRRDHPAAQDDRRLTPLTDVRGRALGADRAESHRSPQRRPVFVAPGPYPGLPGHLSPGRRDPWDPHPAQWTHAGAPEQPGARHYPSVLEQCGCVSPGGAGGRHFNGSPLHTFNGRPPQPLPPPPPEFRGQGDRHRRTADRGAEGGVGEEEGEGEGEEGEGPGTGREHGVSDRRRSEWRAGRPRTPPSYLHVPNGHSGRRVCSETGEGGGKRQDWSWRSKRVSEEGGCSSLGAAHGGFFSTEVPQKHLNHSRRKGPRAPSPAPAPHCREPSISPGRDPPQCRDPDPPQCRDPDPARQGAATAPGSTVHDQIRQVVTNLEDVLGGLKQVHLEMKEVVDQIDRLTANMDLGEESPGVTPLPEPADSHVAPRLGELCAAPVPHHKPPSVQNHVFLRTNAPSPVHVASVVKTSRVPPPSGLAKDAGRKRPQLAANGHLPHLCPSRDSDRQDPWRRAPEPGRPGVTVGNGADSRAPGSRTQKPPPYPQNGRCGKGPGPPPIPVKTQTPYPGRRRQNTSMV